MKAKYYSPRIRRDLVSRLHQEKQARGIPMTRLADQLISAALLCGQRTLQLIPGRSGGLVGSTSRLIDCHLGLASTDSQHE